MRVCFFEVLGDATLITTKNHHHILIDGGNDPRILEKLSDQMPFWDRTVDTVVLTHFDHDHTYGLTEVMQYYQVNNVLWSGNVRDSFLVGVVQSLIRQHQTTSHIAHAEMGWVLDNLTLQTLFPFDSQFGKRVTDPNAQSLVINIFPTDQPKSNVFLTGDIGTAEERDLLQAGYDVRSNILKIAHHGSYTSSSEQFLKAASPQISIISAGKNNPYHHPHDHIAERVVRASGTTFVTGETGDICFVLHHGDFQKI